MGGTIRGFIGGAGKGAADFAMMTLQNNMKKERDEANYLRNRELGEAKQEFATEEREASQEFRAEESTKAQKVQKDIAAMKPAARPQLIKYTDSKGNEQEGILQKNASGSFSIVKPNTGEIMESEITREELKNKAAQMNVAEGRGEDWIPWNELGPKDPEVRAAVTKERAKGKGIIDSQMRAPKASATKPAAKAKDHSGLWGEDKKPAAKAKPEAKPSAKAEKPMPGKRGEPAQDEYARLDATLKSGGGRSAAEKQQITNRMNELKPVIELTEIEDKLKQAERMTVSSNGDVIDSSGNIFMTNTERKNAINKVAELKKSSSMIAGI